jgi:signal transduction histidine kinase
VIRNHVVVFALLVAAAMSARPAVAQDLSSYRGIPFGSSVASVIATTGLNSNASAVKVVHQRPALLQELAWRPQYSNVRPGAVEAAQEITFRFHDDQLFSVTVLYEARLVAGLTNMDVIDAVSAVYGPPTLTPAAKQGPVAAPAGTINGSTALARWQNGDHEFTLLREVYPATYRLVGVSKRLDALARASAIESVRLDRLEAPKREAAEALAEAERKRIADEKVRTTNRGEFKP